MSILIPGLYHYLALSAILFVIALFGLLTSKNVIRVLMCIELLLNTANINLVAFAAYTDPNFMKGGIFAIFVMAVAAAEAAVAFAIIISLYRSKKSVDMEDFDLLKW